MVQHRMKTSNRHVLTDNHKVGRRVAATNHGEHVGVGKDPQFRILFIEVTRDPRCAFTKRENFSCYFIALPLSSPGLSTRTEIHKLNKQFQFLVVVKFNATLQARMKGCYITIFQIIFMKDHIQIEGFY